ncbi:MAG: BrnA antitoxin family protein [Sphingomonas sp.]|nr:BrnA antitoxin family protein [Sphingomonas sp.]
MLSASFRSGGVMMAKNGSITALEADPNDPEDFEVSAEAVAQALAERRRRLGGRPRGSDKEQVSLRLDKDILARFRADGPGWQTRINEALRKGM